MKSNREFNNYEEAQQDESCVNVNDAIKNIVFYDKDGNVIPIDINNFKGSFIDAYDDSHFMRIKGDINEDTIPNINRYYDFYLFLPLKPGMYRYDTDYNNWRSFSADKIALKEWEVFMVEDPFEAL